MRARIEAACAAAGRRPEDITLIAVGKGMPAERVAEFLLLGVADVGENKAQEATAKAAEIASSRPELVTRWHFIGQLQRNKVSTVAAFASMVHSVDRPALVAALDRAAARRERALDVLLQLDLDPDPDPARGGVAPNDFAALADAVLDVEHLVLRGVMTVAPPGGARRSFDRLVRFSESLQALQPSATVVSAGMSADIEAAISAGATHLRVGTALFGDRKLASEHRT